VRSGSPNVKQLADFYLWFFFGVLSLLHTLMGVTFQLLGEDSALHCHTFFNGNP